MIALALQAPDLAHLPILLIIGFAIFAGTVGARIFQKLRIPQVVGYIAIGVGYGWGDSLEPKEIHHNDIEMVARKITGRSKEYGDSSNLSGLRVTMYRFRGENFNFHDNTVIIHGRHANQMRGIWISPTMKTKNIIFKNNYIKTIAYPTTQLGNRRGAASISIAGSPGKTPDQPPTILRATPSFPISATSASGSSTAPAVIFTC